MHHCGRFERQPLDRREMLSRCAQGFGAVALTALAGDALFGDVPGQPGLLDRGHIPARARSVIFLYMDGGPSQVDTFDPKPALSQWDGKPFPSPIEPTQFNPLGHPHRNRLV